VRLETSDDTLSAAVDLQEAMHAAGMHRNPIPDLIIASVGKPMMQFSSITTGTSTTSPASLPVCEPSGLSSLSLAAGGDGRFNQPRRLVEPGRRGSRGHTRAQAMPAERRSPPAGAERIHDMQAAAAIRRRVRCIDPPHRLRVGGNRACGWRQSYRHGPGNHRHRQHRVGPPTGPTRA
jgi:hypothetical protein